MALRQLGATWAPSEHEQGELVGAGEVMAPFNNAGLRERSSRAAHRLDGDGRWVALPPMVKVRRNHSLCEHGGYLYAAGGCPVSLPPEERYDRAVERFDGERWAAPPVEIAGLVPP